MPGLRLFRKACPFPTAVGSSEGNQRPPPQPRALPMHGDFTRMASPVGFVRGRGQLLASSSLSTVMACPMVGLRLDDLHCLSHTLVQLQVAFTRPSEVGSHSVPAQPIGSVPPPFSDTLEHHQVK